MTASQPFIVSFYSSSSGPSVHPSVHPSARLFTQSPTLSAILSYSDNNLEFKHDYIQLLFPLPEPSPFNPFAPVIDAATFHAFRSSSDPTLRANLLLAFKRMLAFYGFDYTPSAAAGARITPSSNFPQQAKRWVRSFNHNHLRITRILRSLRVLGCEEQAEEWWRALVGLRTRELGGIGARSWMYWERAVRRPLWVAPDVEVVPARGRGWLWEWEQAENEKEKEGKGKEVKGLEDGVKVVEDEVEVDGSGEDEVEWDGFED